MGLDNGENDIRLGRSRSLDRRSKQDASRRSRTRIYSFGFIVPDSPIVKGGSQQICLILSALENQVWHTFAVRPWRLFRRSTAQFPSADRLYVSARLSCCFSLTASVPSCIDYERLVFAGFRVIGSEESNQNRNLFGFDETL